MKNRRVFVTLEVETKAKLSDLRVAQNWTSALYGCPSAMWGKVLQAQANVAQAPPTRKQAMAYWNVQDLPQVPKKRRRKKARMKV